MRLPTLTELESSRDIVEEFRGYNHNLRINDCEFYDMKNLTSSYYPILAPRGQRGTYLEADFDGVKRNVQGIIAKDNLCYVRNDDFYINGNLVEGFKLDARWKYRDDETAIYGEDEKVLISMGAYVIILPDKKYINTLKTSDYGNIENTYTTKNSIIIEPCDADGKELTASKSKPPDPADGQLWLDTSVTPNVLKKWSETSKMWVQVATTYVKIEHPDIGKGFKEYDGVTISGLKDTTLINADNGKAVESADAIANISAIDGSFVIQKRTDDYIVVIGILDRIRILSNSITVERKMPDMDYITESENRLWGCKYGAIYKDGVYEKTVNEIYSCKLGDFTNWNCFMGLSTDSYVASCGTDGAFTGAVTHLGYPLFFKEDCFHKVYGNYPANFQIQTIAGRGVQKGCNKSLAIVNEVLYYKAKSGVCAYDGSLPVEVSAEFGNDLYSHAVGGWLGNKYYLSMEGTDKQYTLFVYDTVKGMWHKEDNTHVSAFTNCNNELYFIEDGSIKTVCGSGTLDTNPVSWMAETSTIGIYSPDKKYLSKLNVRISLDIGTRVYFYVQYDSFGDWESVCSLNGTRLNTFTVPIKPKRHDHMRLRIVGEGNARIYSITKTTEQGSDF